MILGFLGTGRISSSVIEGIFKSKLKIKKIYISPRNRLISKKLSKRFKKVIVSNNNQQVIDRSSWVFLAVTPNVGNKILKRLSFNKSKSWIYLGNLIVQYNIWLNGNKKLKKNKIKQNIKAKKDFAPNSLIFFFFLNPPFASK